MNWCRACIVLACTVQCSDAAFLMRAASLQETADSNGDWAALNQAESEDRSFLFSQLDKTENQLVKLEQLAAPVKAAAEKKVEAKAAVAPAAKKTVATTAVKKEVVAKADAKDADPAKILASLGLPKLNLGKSGKANTAMLAPMLAMLKGLYQDSKDRISQQNTREEKSKKWFTGKEAEHKLKMDTIEAKAKNHTLSEEFRTNETRDETRYFSYWSRCRERQHRQFHTNLKIQHAMMMKTKTMIDMYEKTLSGKAGDQEQARKAMTRASGGMPEIVFLQTVRGFCRESLDEVRKERAQMQADTDAGAGY